jgi:hypothetical protein
MIQLDKDTMLGTRASINALWILALNRDIATQIMMHNGIQKMLAILEDPTIDHSDSLISNVTACLCTVAYTPTVRDLIWTLLRQQTNGLHRLVEKVQAKEFGTAFHAAAIVALLMLNDRNVKLLRQIGGIDSLRTFCETRVRGDCTLILHDFYLF